MAIDSICSFVGATHEQSIYIEKEVQEVANLRERNAFEDGFYIGVELMNGNVFKEVQTK